MPSENPKIQKALKEGKISGGIKEKRKKPSGKVGRPKKGSKVIIEE